MRNSNKELEEEGDKRLAIPITVRQLEAVVRISESLAKMELKPFATDAHVDEAIRIFQVGRLLSSIIGISSSPCFRSPHYPQPNLVICLELKVSPPRRTRTSSTRLRSS